MSTDAPHFPPAAERLATLEESGDKNMSTQRKLFWAVLFLALFTVGAIEIVRALNVAVIVHVFVPDVGPSRTTSPGSEQQLGRGKLKSAAPLGVAAPRITLSRTVTLGNPRAGSVVDAGAASSFPPRKAIGARVEHAPRCRPEENFYRTNDETGGRLYRQLTASAMAVSADDTHRA